MKRWSVTAAVTVQTLPFGVLGARFPATFSLTIRSCVQLHATCVVGNALWGHHA